ncbi:MAG: hypothetical protein ACK4UK_01035 [Flavobacterium sp.]
MIKKLSRDYCIICYRSLPLHCYVKKTDSDIYYYPEKKGFYWIKIEDYDSSKMSRMFIDEIVRFLELMELNNFIFLSAYNKPWISKIISKTKDNKKLIKALTYFKAHKIWTHFNGGVEVEMNSLKEFLIHFYTVTRFYAGFSDYYFTDINQNVILYIHYSGEVNVITLNDETDNKFKKVVKETPFVDDLSFDWSYRL